MEVAACADVPMGVVAPYGSSANEASAREEEVQALRDEVAKLRAELEAIPRLLGISSSLCGGCSSPDTAAGRAFVESKRLYCEDCWTSWERCGWWHSTMRVSTVPPEVGKSGLPEWRPEDAFFVPELVCSHTDMSLLKSLQAEAEKLEGREFCEWHGARHLGLQFEGHHLEELRSPIAPPNLQKTVKFLEEKFGIRASAARLNIYRSSSDYKPFHADRGMDENGTPQVTVGLSLGMTRELALTHWQTGLTVMFPQKNGDVFAFTPELNRVFLHGVPRAASNEKESEADQETPRMSLILWGAQLTHQLDDASDRH